MQGVYVHFYSARLNSRVYLGLINLIHNVIGYSLASIIILGSRNNPKILVLSIPNSYKGTIFMDSIWRLVFDIRYIIQLHTSSPVAWAKEH